MKLKTIFFITLLLFTHRICFGDWQDILDVNFDHADTFDRYEDWVPGYTSNLPILLGATGPDWIKRYSYFDSTIPLAARPKAITTSSKSVNNTKSLRLNWLGNGEGMQEAGGNVFYFGDGTEDSGYNEIHIFFMCYIPSDRFVTHITGQDSVNTRYAGRKVVGTQPLLSSSSKMVEVSMGFTGGSLWSDDGVFSNPCRWGWSELHYFLATQRGVSANNEIRCVLDSGGSYFTQVVGGVNVAPWLDQIFWVEIYIKRDSIIGTNDGATWVKFYKEDMSSTTVLSINNMSIVDPDNECEADSGVSEVRGNTMKYNWIHLESNWRVADPDRYIRCEDLYSADNQYIRHLDCASYYDDIIVDDSEIASTYFSLLAGTALYSQPTITVQNTIQSTPSTTIAGTYTKDNTLTAICTWSHSNGKYSGICLLAGGAIFGNVTSLQEGNNTVYFTLRDSQNQVANTQAIFTYLPPFGINYRNIEMKQIEIK